MTFHFESTYIQMAIDHPLWPNNNKLLHVPCRLWWQISFLQLSNKAYNGFSRIGLLHAEALKRPQMGYMPEQEFGYFCLVIQILRHLLRSEMNDGKKYFLMGLGNLCPIFRVSRIWKKKSFGDWCCGTLWWQAEAPTLGHGDGPLTA